MNNPRHTQGLKPLSINGLLCLLGRPKDFFSGAFNLKHIPSLLVIGLICGLERANAMLSLSNISADLVGEVLKIEVSKYSDATICPNEVKNT